MAFMCRKLSPDPTAVLLDIARAVSSTLNLQELLKLIAQQTATACGADVCSIFLSRRPLAQPQETITLTDAEHAR